MAVKINKNKVTALFGTSANPPTGRGGHKTILEWLVGNTEKLLTDGTAVCVYDVWVLPVYKHVFQEKKNLLDFNHRYQMAKLMAEPFKRVQVKTYEKDCYVHSFSNKNIGTIDVVRYLQNVFPSIQFVLVLGEDVYSDLRKGRWKLSKDLQCLIPIIVIKRFSQLLTRNVVVNHLSGLTSISSSAVRQLIKNKQVTTEIESNVLAYIQQHALYSSKLCINKEKD